MQNLPYRVFYKPKDAVAADFIPFAYDGKFRIFYLHDWRNASVYGEGTPWFLIETDDFLHFEERGEVLPRGSVDDPDLYVFTGSVLRAEGRFHIFYTAHNPYLAKRGRPMELIAHAVSDDLVHWTKLPEDSFAAEEGFDPDNLRDPFVFRDDDAGVWRMACVKRPLNGVLPSGATGQYISDDLKTWRPAPDFWAPNLFHTHECPDLFRMGDWWYLIYSEYSDRSRTRYVMSKDLMGPWQMPDDDVFDSRAYYAAKSWADGGRRYLFGWIPTHENDTDGGNWQWGGNLGVLELVQRPDGTLSVRMPESIDKAFRAEAVCPPCCMENRSGYAEQPLFDNLSGTYRIDTVLTAEPGTHAFGITFARDAASRAGYRFELIPSENRILFGRMEGIRTRDLTRSVRLTPGHPVTLRIIVDCDICVAYINDEYAFSARILEPAGTSAALYSVCGAVSAGETTLFRLP